MGKIKVTIFGGIAVPTPPFAKRELKELERKIPALRKLDYTLHINYNGKDVEFDVIGFHDIENEMLWQSVVESKYIDNCEFVDL